jgi:protein AbiQ
VKFRICKIKQAYIDYLKKFDSQVADNYNEKRVYIGIVLRVNDCEYFAPFTSPKDKHKNMKNDKIDYEKIDNGKYGLINFNNMIPVPNDEVIHFDIDAIQDIKYRNILRNQFVYCHENYAKIINKVNKLYEKVAVYHTPYYMGISCEFALLEVKMHEYNAMKEVAAIKEVID